MDWLMDPHAWVGFATLLALEIVLGIDNVVFISILAGKLPASQQAKARFLGLGLAMVMRIVLLFSIAWVIRLTAPLFTIFNQEISGRDLILIIGGLFLIAKSTHEIHQKLEGEEGRSSSPTCRRPLPVSSFRFFCSTSFFLWIPSSQPSAWLTKLASWSRQSSSPLFS